MLRQLALSAALFLPAWAAAPLRIATFQADVTPPLGAPLCCDGKIRPAESIVDPLSARGIVLLGSTKPIVLVVVDWVGIGNGGSDQWRQAVAKAVHTDIGHVAVHTIHVHDAPSCDSTAARLLKPFGLADKLYHQAFERVARERTAAAARQALSRARPVTHVGLGRAAVEKVASNRRMLGPGGKVQFGRMSSCKVAAWRDAPEGLIDPYVRMISFWQQDQPVVVLTYYACHPQSYYGKGGVSADFVGMARSLREASLPGVPHIHFDGAGGNVAAGKYNDGSPEMRPELARRLAAGMKAAWESTVRTSIGCADIEWRSVPVALPVAEGITDTARLQQTLANSSLPITERLSAARNLAWVRLRAQGRRIPLFGLRLGQAYALFLPGELFVEYQIEAQRMRPAGFVAVAAYGDYAPGYIGTRIAYSQGGYETGPASRTAPEVEDVLMGAIRRLLE